MTTKQVRKIAMNIAIAADTFDSDSTEDVERLKDLAIELFAELDN